MLENKKQLLVIPIFAVFSSIFSVIHQNRISSEGFFSIYRGPTYIGKGWPWMYLRIYESGEVNLSLDFLLLTFVFWIIVGVLFFLTFKALAYLVSKVKNRNIT